MRTDIIAESISRSTATSTVPTRTTFSLRTALATRICYDSLMDLRVPPELEDKLNRLAAEFGRDVDHIALDLLTAPPITRIVRRELESVKPGSESTAEER